MSSRLTTGRDVPPSYFAGCGRPLCSIWGKTEIECIALAYVQALAKGGDTWRRLTREQVYELLSDDLAKDHYVGSFLTSDFDVYKRWFESVADQVTDSDGAFGVGGLCWRRR